MMFTIKLQPLVTECREKRIKGETEKKTVGYVITPQSGIQKQYNTRAVRWKTKCISPIYNTDFAIVLHNFLEIFILYFLSMPSDKSTLF